MAQVLDGIAPGELILFSVATFAASLVAGLAGFAFGLVAAAIWLHVLTPLQTTTLIVAFGLVVQGLSVWRLRRSLRFVALWLWPAANLEELEHEHALLEHQHLHVHDEHHHHQHEGWESHEPHRHHRMRHCHGFVIDLHPQWSRSLATCELPAPQRPSMVPTGSSPST